MLCSVCSVVLFVVLCMCAIVFVCMCDIDCYSAATLYFFLLFYFLTSLLPLHYTAFVSLFPPLHELGGNMLNNFQSWGERRKLEIMTEDTPG